MNTAEILKKVRQIEIKTGRLVSETFAGEYQSVFKGRGMEFAEVREYVPGDDVRTIDWNVTARYARPFVKRFVEERELTLMIVCDMSASQFFGSGTKAKNEAAAELGAMFAFSALKNNDKTGLLVFTDGPELYIPPRKGKNHILRIIREILAYSPRERGTSVARALDTVNRLMKRRGIIILISDFNDSGYEKALRRTAVRHDLIPVMVEDRLERTLPKIGGLLNAELLEDAGAVPFLADLSSPDFLARYAADRAEASRAVARTFKSAGADWILVDPAGDIYGPVVKFFKKRERKIRR
ncbi:MAG: hypothetical protein A2X28_07260 [Elusimicrobia bacterium GWA2_56_46]|nr:MAG: hypothetical protein A2X28_07260 [Elusimicrobia bacterium GWA2_56_46]OGR54757.1 MAG: hypothetical protein A2X39_10730 [Elusimicrobia bacterium GWC2_56_31]HBB66015.1 DUF58 domain-containing protein [Elusimicrobiota bacterium]HBW23453.1 DUF58 domain-containing protein [Elusimicrobiota bacterium]